MAVSLKKPCKVDLSKPDLPRKLPECTPVHLIDEEETIVKNDDRISPKSSLPVIDHSGFDPSTLVSSKQINFKPIIELILRIACVLLIVALGFFVITSTSGRISNDNSSDLSFFAIFRETLSAVFCSPLFLVAIALSALIFVYRMLTRFRK